MVSFVLIGRVAIGSTSTVVTKLELRVVGCRDASIFRRRGGVEV